MYRLCMLGILLAGSIAAQAADSGKQTVIATMKKISPSAKIQRVEKSAVPGFYVVIAGGHVFFISDDGKFLIQGAVFNINTRKNIGDKHMAAMRKDLLTRIPADKRITFAPSHPKYHVTVFTDPKCPYCKEFHKKIAEYNKLGIAVDYVLFPLSIHPGADKLAQTIWCSKDRHSAYTEALSGEKLDPKTCKNPLSQIDTIADNMGISGTPTILSDDGTQLGGYIDPPNLAKRLKKLAQPDQVAAN